ncbi:hypothetical protein [Flagellimonas meishanensis]|uniref:hypothetical protein n=1 Tax=Flagellimonas meishanensis TaxID=2873264 RepID=UPI001CA732AB|nr:hypothetical protein [[Muricauda] meishanensis]
MPLVLFSQNKFEQEISIAMSDFPEKALALVNPYFESAKRIRFYREVDSLKTSYEVKFKKDRLYYSVEFSDDGTLEDVEFIIKKNDVPEESWDRITQQLNDTFEKVKIKKIQQQYPLLEAPPKQRIKDAFQNLILPDIHYEIIFSAKKDSRFMSYEGLFHANGKLLKLRKSLNPGYDHLLY